MNYSIKNIFKIAFIIIAIPLFLALNSCNDCTGTNPTDSDTTNYIYFSSIPINSDKPNIYRTSVEGLSIKEIVKNSILYSAPSKDKKLCYVSINEQNKKALFTCNINGGDIKQISADDFWQTLEQPVISPDGRYIGVYTGFNDLYVATSNGSFWRKVTSNYYRSSLPSFSFDGNYLAYYESISLSEPWKLKVVKTSNLQEVVYEKSFSTGINQWFGDFLINWSKDNKKVFFSAVNNNLNDIICVTDISTMQEEELEIKYLGSAMQNIYLEENLITFVGKDGNIWARDYQGNNIQYYRYTNSDTTEVNLYPNFSKNGKNILFNRYFRDDYGLLKSSLMLFVKNSNRIINLCDNAFRGFWSN